MPSIRSASVLLLAAVTSVGLVMAGDMAGAPVSHEAAPVPDPSAFWQPAGYAFAQNTSTLDVNATDNLADTDDLLLGGPAGIATFESDGSTYAAVVSAFEDGVQIIDISDPAGISAAGKIGNSTSASTAFYRPFGIAAFESGDATYAAVAVHDENGVQILKLTSDSGAILENPAGAGKLADTTGSSGLLLDASIDIATFEYGGATYAAVTASADDQGIQILKLTDDTGAILDNPAGAGNLADTGGLLLRDPQYIATFESDGTTYAAVTALTDNGVQIVQIGDTGANTGTTPPAAEAGPDLEVEEGKSVALQGSGSDADGDSLTYSWSEDPLVSYDDRTSPTPQVTASPVASDTEVTLTLTVSDGTASRTDTMVLTILDVSHRDFVTVWNTAGNNESIIFPGTGTYDIDWGDGSTPAEVTGTRTHQYATAGEYTVRVSGGLERFHLGATDGSNAQKLQSIEQWGEIEWTSMREAFSRAVNMEYAADDEPDLSGVTDMTGTFSNAYAFNGDLSDWDVSGVTDMTGTFFNAYAFNQPLDSSVQL